MRDLYQGIKNQIDFHLEIREKYETQVVSKNQVLDIGGRNSFSKSRQRINLLNQNPNNTIVSTDVIDEYVPDIVDDICHTQLAPNSFDGVYCDAILEHVQEYWKAIDNIYNILPEKGEAFFYVPFIFAFHDLMDYHRFTFTEVSRMLSQFSEIKVFVPGKNSGFGYVFWYIVTFGAISKLTVIHRILTQATNGILSIILFFVYFINNQKIIKKYGDISFEDFRFYYVYLYLNHGFCAWVRK